MLGRSGLACERPARVIRAGRSARVEVTLAGSPQCAPVVAHFDFVPLAAMASVRAEFGTDPFGAVARIPFVDR